MKNLLRKIFSPVLHPFERGDGPYVYKPLNRKVLIAASVMFLFLAVVVFLLIPDGADRGYLLPVGIFSLVALVGLIVGLLGNERAVAKIWGNK